MPSDISWRSDVEWVLLTVFIEHSMSNVLLFVVSTWLLHGIITLRSPSAVRVDSGTDVLSTNHY